MSVPAQIIKNGPNRVQNRPFGLKLGPEACQDRSGAFGMGLTHSKGPSPAKKVKKCARAAPGLAGRYITLGSAAKGYVSDLTVGGGVAKWSGRRKRSTFTDVDHPHLSLEHSRATA